MWVVAGVEHEEIKLAGVRAELGNILLTYLCKYIQCKVAGRGCKTRIIDRLVELRLCKIRSIIGLESESVLFSMLDIFNGAITFTFYRLFMNLIELAKTDANGPPYRLTVFGRTMAVNGAYGLCGKQR